MKKLILAILIFPVLAMGQASPPSSYTPQLITYQGAPFGVCSVYQLAENVTNGTYYTCNISSHTWSAIGSGSGTVSSISGTSPIVATPAPTTGVGSLSCPTCVTGTFTPGQTVFAGSSQGLTAGTVTLDMAGISGADLGAIMNNCASALPAAGGICRGDNLTGALTWSTAVTTSVAVQYTFCGQAITQTGAFVAGVANSGIYWCPAKTGSITKGANIDQISLNSANDFAINVPLVGNKASFTGNGIVIAAGATNARVDDNVISGESNDDIKEIGNTFSGNFISHNNLQTWGVHAYEGTGTAAASVFANNTVSGDGTGTGSAVLGSGDNTIEGNFILDANSQPAVDITGSGAFASVVGNFIRQTNGQAGIKINGLGTATGNIVYAGGASNPAIASTGGIISSNYVLVTGGDGIDITSNFASVSNNTVTTIWSGVSNKCAINIVGDVIGDKVAHNQINITDTAADTNYGTCDTPSGSHNLGIVFTGNQVSGVLSGGATVFGHWTNNAANLNTSWSLTVTNLGCVHITTCLKRTDTQSNISVYRDIQPGDGTMDNGSGGINDIFVNGGSSLGSFGASVYYGVAACEATWGTTTVSGGATTTTSLSCLPANSIIDAVVYRITTTITTAASFTIGDSGSATRYCGTQSTLTAGTTGLCTAAGYYLNSSALGVKFTPNTTPGAGAVRFEVFYHTWTAPTS